MNKKLLGLAAAAVAVCGLASCNKEVVKVSTYEAKNVSSYSMDLSGIEGYKDKSVVAGTWAETYDKLIDFINKEKDQNVRFQLLHAAEDLLMDTGSIVPIYYYTDIYMKKANVTGFYSSPLGYKYFQKTTYGSATELPVCLASEPQTIDPALNSAVDGATLLVHLNANLVRYGENGLEADCVESLVEPQEVDGKFVYTYTLKQGLQWSNGDELKASDFVNSWKRASSVKLGADYGYMFAVIDGYDDGIKKGENGYEAMPLNAVADDTNRTIKVTLPVDVPYWEELLAFPAYQPVHSSCLEYDAEAGKKREPGSWATQESTWVSCGAYKLKTWEHKQYITLEKNDKYWDNANTKMPSIKFVLQDDDAVMLASYKTNELAFIDSVPNDEIEALKTQYGEGTASQEFFVGSQLGTYYVTFNNNVDFLLPGTKLPENVRYEANKEIRKALSLLLDRDHICKNIGKAGQVPASSFVALGLTDPSNNDEQFYQHAGHSSDYIGYYNANKEANESNVAQAIAILKQYFDYDEASGKFTNFPAFDYLYNNGSAHQAIGEYIQQAFKAYGIPVNLVNQEWNAFLETRKKGDYGVARNGWLGDYNDPISFLDMWITGSGNNDAQFGK